jgi:hypothetical protein
MYLIVEETETRLSRVLVRTCPIASRPRHVREDVEREMAAAARFMSMASMPKEWVSRSPQASATYVYEPA